MIRRMAEREHDIVVFGCTGFTGELTARYLAEHAPESTRWALAGRNQSKLEAVKERLGVDVPLLHADSDDRKSLDEVAASTRVIITTVGPYLHYGEPLVAACAAAGTDYVDLTGEPEFVDLMYLHHHDAAV
jgi:saccharopine dehydrogenase (NAD+, L-glutamate forming)